MIRTEYDRDGDGVYDSITRYSYDERGRKTCLAEADATGTVVHRFTYEYDSRDQVTRIVEYGAGDNPFRFFLSTYDEHGDPTGVSVVNPGIEVPPLPD